MLTRIFNENRRQKLELSLETISDTVYYGDKYPYICKLKLSNPTNKPYCLLKPTWVQHNDSHYLGAYNVVYKKENCSYCYFENEDIIRPVGPTYKLLIKGKPFILNFSPVFDELTFYDCKSSALENDELYGEYQIRVYIVIDSDTIYSNPVNIWYLEKE